MAASVSKGADGMTENGIEANSKVAMTIQAYRLMINFLIIASLLNL
jgi:hypothetical protein